MRNNRLHQIAHRTVIFSRATQLNSVRARVRPLTGEPVRVPTPEEVPRTSSEFFPAMLPPESPLRDASVPPLIMAPILLASG